MTEKMQEAADSSEDSSSTLAEEEAGEALEGEGSEEEESPQLYELELERYRATLERGWEAAYDRYGFTMIHSISPEEYVGYRSAMGFKMQQPLDWYNLGCAAALKEEWAPAIKLFDKCLAKDARFAPALFNRAVARENMADATGAAVDFRAYVKLLSELDEHQDFPIPEAEEREAEAEAVRVHVENLEKIQ